jgi:hypothetical protein
VAYAAGGYVGLKVTPVEVDFGDGDAEFFRLRRHFRTAPDLGSMAKISFRGTFDDLDEGYFAVLNVAGRRRPSALQALAAQIRAAYDNAGGDAGEEKVRPSAICKSVQPLILFAANRK